MLKGFARLTMVAGAVTLFTSGCMVDSGAPLWMIFFGVVLGNLLLLAGDIWLQYLKATERIRRIKKIRRRQMEMKKSA